LRASVSATISISLESAAFLVTRFDFVKKKLGVSRRPPSSASKFFAIQTFSPDAGKKVSLGAGRFKLVFSPARPPIFPITSCI